MGHTLRQLLEARFGELPEAVWQAVVKRGYADSYELAADDEEAQEAFDSAVAFLKRRGFRPRPQSPESSCFTLFSAHALSKAFVAIQWGELQRILHAPDDELTLRERTLRDAIVDFRAKFLQGGLIPEDSIPQWLREHEQFTPTFWVKVALPEGVWWEVWNALLQNRSVEYTLTLTRETVRELLVDAPTLQYDDCAYRVAPELLQAVQEVQRFTGWTETQAVRFVLANAMPKGLPVECTVQWGLTEGITYLNLRLPPFLEVDAIAQLYRALQKQVYANRKRLQGIQERQAALIRFVEAYCAQHPQARWRDVAQAWNEHCLQQERPQWQVSESSLRRHYERYIRSVLELVQGFPVGNIPTGDDAGA